MVVVPHQCSCGVAAHNTPRRARKRTAWAANEITDRPAAIVTHRSSVSVTQRRHFCAQRRHVRARARDPLLVCPWALLAKESPPPYGVRIGRCEACDRALCSCKRVLHGQLVDHPLIGCHTSGPSSTVILMRENPPGRPVIVDGRSMRTGREITCGQPHPFTLAHRRTRKMRANRISFSVTGLTAAARLW